MTIYSIHTLSNMKYTCHCYIIDYHYKYVTFIKLKLFQHQAVLTESCNASAM